MIIAIDEAIPYWKEAFSQFGEVRTFHCRNLKPEDIRNANVLIVRSITRVDESLLKGSSVSFVASASAGNDNLNQVYLRLRGIQFTNATGCNADAVAEYTTAALHAVARKRNWDLKQKSLAVIGVGNVGSHVVRHARALGMRLLMCDPPIRDATKDKRYMPFNEVLGADILTFHVPLTSDGPYPTHHMLDQLVLEHLSPHQYLINTSRGPVFDNQALKAALKAKRIEGAVLDVWEGEPTIDQALLQLADIGTPHIAGCTWDGKIRATEMVYQALCKRLKADPSWETTAYFPEPRHIQPEKGTVGQNAARSVILQAYNIMQEDSKLRALASLSAEQSAAEFDRIRGEFPQRLEFRHFIVELYDARSELAETLEALGFKVQQKQ